MIDKARPIARNADDPEINQPRGQQIQGLGRGAVDDRDSDPRIALMKNFEVRNEVVPAQGIADADLDQTFLPVPDLFQYLLTVLQMPEGLLHVVKENVPFRGQRHASRTTGKQGAAGQILQFFDRLADGRLADKKLPGRSRDIAATADNIEHLVEFSIDHDITPDYSLHDKRVFYLYLSAG